MSTSKTKSWDIRSNSDLGRAVAGVRREHNLTQADLAERINVHRSYLAELERGQDSLALERALRALRRMGASVTVALEVEEDGESN